MDFVIFNDLQKKSFRSNRGIEIQKMDFVMIKMLLNIKLNDQTHKHIKDEKVV